MSFERQNQRIGFEMMNVDDVPLPNELPERQNLPGPSYTHSPTLNSVLQQNQDLMNRLSIALKFSHDLESAIENMRERNHYLELQAKTVNAELSQMTEELKATDYKIFEIRQQRDTAEKTLAEYQMQAGAELRSLSRLVRLYQNYRRRINNWIKPNHDNLKSQLVESHQDRIRLVEDNEKLRLQNANLKDQLSSAVNRIQTQHIENENNQKSIVEAYEQQIRILESDKNLASQELHALRQRNQEIQGRLNSLTETHALIENRSIYLERKLTEETDLQSKQIKSLQITNAELNGQNQQLSEQLSDLRASLNDKTQSESDLIEQVKNLSEQFRGLQQLWKESTTENDDLRQQLESYKKINSELSRSLNEKRHSLEEMQMRLHKFEEASTQKIRALYASMKPVAASPVPNRDSVKEEVSRLESLLSEIQSGSLRKIQFDTDKT